MEPSAAVERGAVRLLGLGNELMADDAFGLLVARRAAELYPELEVASSSEAGLGLLDHLTGISRLIIVDTVQTGRCAPGTIHIFRADELRAAPGGSLHGAGLPEALALARKLDPEAPKEVLVLAVEAADCSTVGGPMDPAVEAALPGVLERIGEALAGRALRRPDCARPGRSPR